VLIATLARWGEFMRQRSGDLSASVEAILKWDVRRRPIGRLNTGRGCRWRRRRCSWKAAIATMPPACCARAYPSLSVRDCFSTKMHCRRH